MRTRRLSWLLVAMLLLATRAFALTETTLPGGRFGQIAILEPATPAHVALFISGDGGWNKGVVDMARALANSGVLVAGIDMKKVRSSVAKSAKHCEYLAGDFETLSHNLQKQLQLPRYHEPVLVGYSSGATLAYAIAAQAPPGTFAGALSLGFCPDLEIDRPMCPGEGLTSVALPKAKGWMLGARPDLSTDWIALQGQIDQVCLAETTQHFASAIPSAQVVPLPKVGHGYSVPANWLPQFRTAFTTLAANDDPPVPTAAELSDLPLIEVPAMGPPRDTMAVLLSGDGGWAGLDRQVSSELANAGIGVVGISSLQYFWKPRTAESAAHDLNRVIEHYTHAWGKRHILLIGYSFGADALPSIINNLPESTRRRVSAIALLGLTANATFEVHVTEWIHHSGDGEPNLPQVGRLPAVPLLCVYGEGEDASLCPQLSAERAHILKVGEGHHFGGDYREIAHAILGLVES